jgi:murein DD-endopeptidase MepM/ murein hydrolase activator NlpD
MSDLIPPFNGSYPVTRPFGVKDPAYSNYPDSKHPGTDWGLPANTPLFAAMDGVCTVYNRDKSIKTGRGKEVQIVNGNKDVNTCHMNRIDVSNGQFVKQGQQIGLSGNTGYVLPAPTTLKPDAGAHLHGELLIDGKYVDFDKYVKEQTMKPLTKGDIVNMYRELLRHDPNENDYKYHLIDRGADWNLFMYDLVKRPDFVIPRYEKQIAELQKALDPKKVELLRDTEDFIKRNKDKV